MILKSRLYERSLPSRDARLFIIYCEGKKREPEYFKYFYEISSRIKLEIIEANQHGNNSPLGLFDKACLDIDETKNNLIPKYDLNEDDQVWFVIDTDEWGVMINEIKEKCESRKNWFVAQSNPCFEVWLYYHFCSKSAKDLDVSNCQDLKRYVNNNVVPGGFDSRKHPVLISEAIQNAENNYESKASEILFGSTELFKLGKEIYSLVKSVVEKARKNNY